MTPPPTPAPPLGGATKRPMEQSRFHASMPRFVAAVPWGSPRNRREAQVVG